MKYKVLKGTKLYSELLALHNRIGEVKEAAKAVVEQLGAKEYCKAQYVAAGGIGAVKFAEKPLGWKSVGDSWQSLYFPKVSNKKDTKLVSDLPVIKYDEVNKIIKFSGGSFTASTGTGIGWVNTYSLMKGVGCFLIEVPEEMRYRPVDDMIEITVSEYKKLTPAEKREKV